MNFDEKTKFDCSREIIGFLTQLKSKIEHFPRIEVSLLPVPAHLKNGREHAQHFRSGFELYILSAAKKSQK